MGGGLSASGGQDNGTVRAPTNARPDAAVLAGSWPRTGGERRQSDQALAPHREHQDHHNGSEQDSRSNRHAGHPQPFPCPFQSRSDIRGDGVAVNPHRSRVPRPQVLPASPDSDARGAAVSEPHLCTPTCAMSSPSEEHSIELSRLRRGQSWLREHVDDLVGQVSLPERERRRVAVVPAQPRTNVRVESHLLARDLVGEPVQVSHLLQQGLELLVVDRHLGSETSPEREGSAASAAGRGRKPGSGSCHSPRRTSFAQRCTTRRGSSLGGSCMSTPSADHRRPSRLRGGGL